MMYVNTCSKCGKSFDTKNPKRIICPECLYPERSSGGYDAQALSGGNGYPSASGPRGTSYSHAPQHGENTRPMNQPFLGTPSHYSGGYRPEPHYPAPQGGPYPPQERYAPQQGGYGQQRPPRREYQGGGSSRPPYGQGRPNYPPTGGYEAGGGYPQRPSPHYMPPQGESSPGGYPPRPRGFAPQGGRPPYGQGRPNSGGGFRRPGGPPRGRGGPKKVLVTKEQLLEIERLYKLALPLPNPDLHEVIAEGLDMQPSKVFFGINLIRQKMKLPKLEYPKRKLAVSPDQLSAVQALYDGFLPDVPIGVHKILAKQLKMDEWRVHVAIKLIRKSRNLPQFNEERTDIPEWIQELIEKNKENDVAIRAEAKALMQEEQAQKLAQEAEKAESERSAEPQSVVASVTGGSVASIPEEETQLTDMPHQA
ncbi:MAG: hypothetical protein ACKO37_02880 [Vampirovibrionales bacterium]